MQIPDFFLVHPSNILTILSKISWVVDWSVSSKPVDRTYNNKVYKSRTMVQLEFTKKQRQKKLVNFRCQLEVDHKTTSLF